MKRLMNGSPHCCRCKEFEFCDLTTFHKSHAAEAISRHGHQQNSMDHQASRYLSPGKVPCPITVPIILLSSQYYIARQQRYCPQVNTFEQSHLLRQMVSTCTVGLVFIEKSSSEQQFSVKNFRKKQQEVL
jgi:hypothetical protein